MKYLVNQVKQNREQSLENASKKVAWGFFKLSRYYWILTTSLKSSYLICVAGRDSYWRDKKSSLCFNWCFCLSVKSASMVVSDSSSISSTQMKFKEFIITKHNIYLDIKGDKKNFNIFFIQFMLNLHMNYTHKIKLHSFIVRRTAI